MTPMYTRLTAEAARGSISRSKTINEIEDPCMLASADIWGLDARARGFERIKKPEHASKHTWQPLSYSTVLPYSQKSRSQGRFHLVQRANSTTTHPRKYVPGLERIVVNIHYNVVFDHWACINRNIGARSWGVTSMRSM